MKRAECPVAKLDFANLVAAGRDATSSVQPQPANHSLVAGGVERIGDALLVSSRALVDEALKNPGVFSSADLVEQGNTLPLIPLNIDPPDHVAYRKLLRCLGSHLARRELRIALREWHRRIPEHSLSPGYQVTYLPPLRYVPDLQLSWPA